MRSTLTRGLQAALTPLGRVPYVAMGALLFALKYALDTAVSAQFGRTFSPLFYVSPLVSPLFARAEDPKYWLGLWGAAVPFMFFGLLLTLRRLKEADLSPWFAALSFVPFANLLFFVAAATAPPPHATPDEPLPEASPYRESATATRLDRVARNLTASVFLAGLFGAVIGLGAVGISVGIMREYGAALMLGAPVISGFATATIFERLRPGMRFFPGAGLATGVSFVLSFGVIVAFALEGVGCLVMALPLIVPVVFFGSFLGHLLAQGAPGKGYAPVCAPFVLMPLLLGAEHGEPATAPRVDVVESEVIVDASPDAVWKRVIAFPPLPPPDDLLFHAGIAVPLRATIDGEGPGAIRRCEFTTGTFVEPVTVWSPGHELSFSVREQPDPMRELTLWDNIRPPHLDGYLQTTRGQFALEALPGGKTRLTGRTWYRTRMQPEAYFRWVSDALIHRIHLRVLEHVASLAEGDVKG
jgi:hypothetical protein